MSDPELAVEFSSVPWEPDIAVLACTLCHARFNLVTRRSHCRACGHVICKKCSPNTNFFFAGDVQLRICTACEKMFTGKPPPAPVNRGHAATQFETRVKQIGGSLIGGHRLVHLIRPGTPEQTGFPFRHLSDETDMPHWIHFERFKGKFIFSTLPISDNEINPETLATHFLSTQEIFGRAIWPTAIRNYALGGKKGQEAEYGPDFIAEWTPQCTANTLFLVMFLKIDGVALVRRTHPKFGGNLCYFQTRGPHPDTGWNLKGQPFQQNPEIIDYYSFTCSIPCKLKANLMTLDPEDEWGKALPSLMVALEQLSIGSHTVEVELCFLITSQPEEKIPPPNNFPERALCQDTLMSYPIAAGCFTYEVKAPSSATDNSILVNESVNAVSSSSSSSKSSGRSLYQSSTLPAAEGVSNLVNPKFKTSAAYNTNNNAQEF